MIISKIIQGHVCQAFGEKTGKFLGAWFTAEGEVYYMKDGIKIVPKEEYYHPFDMKQPE